MTMWARVTGTEPGTSLFINFANARDIHATDGGAALVHFDTGPGLYLTKEQWDEVGAQIAFPLRPF